MDLENRKQALIKLVTYLSDEKFHQNLINAYCRDTGFLRKSIKTREVITPISILNEMANETNLNKYHYVDIKKLNSLGKVAVVLPINGINICLTKSVGASFLVGNETVVKLPRKLKFSSKYYRELVLNNLPNVSFASEDISSEDFLKECIKSQDIKAIVIYGDDHWIWDYKNLVRRNDIKLIFEGPGKDPLIVMQDANIDLAINEAVRGGLLNGGQSCSAIERFFIHESVVNEFCSKLTEKLIELKVGDPESDDTDVGPILSVSVLKRLDEQVKEAKSKGAKILIGGKIERINCSDYYTFLPTVLTECNLEMRIIKEENFGPVFPIISFSSEDDLLFKVDNCNYGLNASVFGTISNEIRKYLINTHRNVYFDSSVLSFCNGHAHFIDGGYKNSGFIWKWHDNKFLQIEGKRILLKELSQ